MNDLILTVNGLQFGGWKSVNINRSIEKIAGTFELGLTEKWAEQTINRKIKPGDECAVSIDGENVITGHIDSVSPSYTESSHTLTVVGRDRTGDLVDCSAIYKTGSWENRNIEQIANDLCKPFGINVITKTDIGAPFKTWKLQESETVFETLERAARIRALLLVSDGLGNLIITHAGSDRLNTKLELGENIKAASGSFNHANRFSEYTVKGDHKGNDNVFGGEATGREGKYTDKRITRYRPKIIIAEDQVDNAAAKQRAEWEGKIAYARSTQVTYTVQGWIYNSALWPINYLVPVVDQYQDLNLDLLITGVRFVLDESGSRTELTVTLREAFDLVPLPEPEEDGGLGW